MWRDTIYNTGTCLNGGTTFTPLFCQSIKESEEPKRYLVAYADFGVVIDDVAVGNVFNLSKAFSLSAHLEQPAIIYKKIALDGIYDLMSRCAQLVQEERLAAASRIDFPRKGVHSRQAADMRSILSPPG